MSVYAGCDVGSLTSKAVLMEDGRIIGSAIIKSRPKPDVSARDVMNEVLGSCQMTMGDVARCVGTGYGRDKMGFAHATVSEIQCHARGALWMLPTVRTIIDIGGQDCKAIRLDDHGGVAKFVTNDKCASGTGRFLDVMAGILKVGVDQLGEFSSRSTNPSVLASSCTVWAQADVIKFINSGHAIADVGAGINNAMAGRVAIIANSVGKEKDVCMTGGVAKNSGVVKALENLLGVKIRRLRKADPQLAGAIGAAVLAEEHDQYDEQKEAKHVLCRV